MLRPILLLIRAVFAVSFVFPRQRLFAPSTLQLYRVQHASRFRTNFPYMICPSNLTPIYHKVRPINLPGLQSANRNGHRGDEGTSHADRETWVTFYVLLVVAAVAKVMPAKQARAHELGNDSNQDRSDVGTYFDRRITENEEKGRCTRDERRLYGAFARGGMEVRRSLQRSRCDGDNRVGLLTGANYGDLQKSSYLDARSFSFVASPSGIAPLVPTCCRRVSLRLESPAEEEEEEEEEEFESECEEEAGNDANLTDEFAAGMNYGTELRRRFFAPRIDDPGLPFADALVCVNGALFVAQWALNPLIPLSIRIPSPAWLAPMALPAGVSWKGLPFIFPAFSHGVALAVCWVLGAFAASAYESEAYCGTWQTALSRTWRAGAFAVGLLILSTQIYTYFSLSSQGLDPYTVPTTAGVDQLAQADIQILSTAFELIIDVIVQALFMTSFRLYRWADAQGPSRPGGGQN